MNTDPTSGTPSQFDDVLITEELLRRPTRPPDYEAENRAMAALAAQMAADPHGVPQKLADLVIKLCRADSAGISLLESEGGEEVFRWRAAAGIFAPHLGESMARDASPCGAVVERNELVLLREGERFFPSTRGFEPRMYENMLVPWSADRRVDGTVWVISHHPDRHFDAEDARVLKNLAAFAAAAYRSILSQQEAQAVRRRLARAALERARALTAHNEELVQEVAERRRTEAALRASEEKFRTLADTAPALIWQNDGQGGNLFVNRYFLDFAGRSAEDLHGAGWHALVHPDDAGYIDSYLDAVRAQDRCRYQVRLLRHDGQWRWFDSHGEPLFAPDGRYAGHVGVSLDITDAVLAEEALKEAGRRKDEFLATLAHELRNPLAPISNAVHLLRRPDGRRKADRLLEMVGRQVNQIVRLVDDLMEISRITSGKIELEKRQVALAEVVADAVETSRPAIEQGQHALTVELSAEPLVLDADSVRLIQVLSNLLNNAAKYTDPGGSIRLAVRRDDGEATISVVDNGIGIAPEQLPEVFTMFSQAHLDTGRRNGGLGIGLAMARRLVEMHGGTVEAHSEGAGRGSEFIVRLPLSPGAMEGAREAPGPAPGAPLGGLRILVVDDNRDAADSLAMLLELDGAEVRTVYDGRAALQALEALRPHVVLLDLGMPGMDGYEVARHIRADAGRGEVRIVALTGWGQESDRERTRSGGFDLHLTKPVDLGVLEAWLAGA